MKNHILTLILLFCATLTSAAQTERDSVKVFFHVSHTDIDPLFKDNGRTLDSIFSKMKTDSRLSGPSRRISNVSVTGAASPEGSVEFNRYLSEKRASAIFDEFKKRGLVADSATRFTYLGRDWSGLRTEVAKDTAVPFRKDVIALIDRIGTADTPSHPLAELKSLHDGIPYQYMLSNLFPDLRMSRLFVDYEHLYPHLLIPEMDSEIPMLYANVDAEIPFIYYNSTGSVGRCRPFYLALKTNMLYDALLLPNIGADFYIGKNISITADWMYGWWDHDATHYYWRAYGGNAGMRWWFGRKAHEKPLTGHHLGVFAGVVTYDFELGKGGIMGGIPRGTLWDRCNFISGIEYGYSLPVAKRLNIDFSLAIGYLGGKYLKYEPKKGFYMWQSTHRLHWVGPTKAEISLVWLLGCDNYNRRKGGRR